MSAEIHGELYGNVWIYNMKVEGGTTTHKHKHEFEHIHQSVRGSATIHVYDVEGKEKLKSYKVEAGNYSNIPAGFYHQMEAHEDYEGNCIHAFRDEDEFVSSLRGGDCTDMEYLDGAA